VIQSDYNCIAILSLLNAYKIAQPYSVSTLCKAIQSRFIVSHHPLLQYAHGQAVVIGYLLFLIKAHFTS